MMIEAHFPLSLGHAIFYKIKADSEQRRGDTDYPGVHGIADLLQVCNPLESRMIRIHSPFLRKDRKREPERMQHEEDQGRFHQRSTHKVLLDCPQFPVADKVQLE